MAAKFGRKYGSCFDRSGVASPDESGQSNANYRTSSVKSFGRQTDGSRAATTEQAAFEAQYVRSQTGIGADVAH
jgi:hypothetical protein